MFPVSFPCFLLRLAGIGTPIGGIGALLRICLPMLACEFCKTQNGGRNVVAISEGDRGRSSWPADTVAVGSLVGRGTPIAGIGTPHGISTSETKLL